MDIKQPNRKRHSYTQHLEAPPETVFPLLCPVAELQWAPGWMPEAVFSTSGVVEQECMFITPPETSSEQQQSIWIVSDYNPSNLSLVMYKVAPEHTISKLEISLERAPDHCTQAHVSYEITAIGPAGDLFMTEFTPDWYKTFMLEWEGALNHYLKTGKMIA